MRTRIGLAAGPVAFLLIWLLPFAEAIPGPARITAATTALMAVWWLTEAVPVPATALVPLVLLPATGVMSAAEISTPYANKTNMLFLGGLIIATVAITVLLILVGEVTPKTLALSHAFAVSRVYAWPLAMWARINRPIVWALDALTRLLIKVFGGGESDGAHHDAEEGALDGHGHDHPAHEAPGRSGRPRRTEQEQHGQRPRR